VNTLLAFQFPSSRGRWC